MSIYDETEADITNNLSDVGKSIVIRHVASKGGTNPALNPVQTGSITVAVAASAGNAQITLTAPAGNWFLTTGDKFKIAGAATTYTVTADVTAASGKFTDVSFSPALTADAALGAACSVTWANDYPVKAMVGAYPAKLIDGTLITVRDAQVMAPPVDSNGRTIPPPTPAVDWVGVAGSFRRVGIVEPVYVGEGVVLWTLQAKG